MTKKTNTKKKSSASKKLIPAIGMLTVSAMMLSSATYAWFTMSREVEVKNIQMTASVPEDLQISLGKLTDLKDGGGNPSEAEISAGRATYAGLQGNQGILLKTGGDNADNGNVAAPANDETLLDNLFWSNTVDVSEYYRMGKIIPASSTNGEDIFFTPDASGDGTTLKDGAKFYQAASLDSADFATLFKWDSTNRIFATTASGDPARTTLHAVDNVTRASDYWNSATAEDGTNNKYDSADSWYETNDDGYYVDIPMWIRSSSKDNIKLSVDAFVTTNAGKTDDLSAAADDELYMAARAAIIYASDVSNPTTVNDSTNLLSIRKDTFATTDSIINYMYTTDNSNDAVASLSGTPATTGVYGAAVEYDGGEIIEVPGRVEESGTKKHGDMIKVVVRVWLEGEDPNCWNPNAGQDFNISLKFVKGDIKLATDENASIAYPASWASKAADHAHADANVTVQKGMVVTIKETINGQPNTEIKFTFDGNKWNQTTGSVEILDGKTYKISGNSKTETEVTGAAGIAAWLKDNVQTKADAAATDYAITPTT